MIDDDHLQRDVRCAGLRYAVDDQPGIRRVRASKHSFRYLGPDGKPIRRPATLRRIAALAIPPAYSQVWIAADPRAHLQATGVDARGRKQYRYHPEWRRSRDAAKFRKMVEFGRALPRLRRRIRNDLQQPGLPRSKVLALLAALLDRTRLRIGNESYARSNGSFGLTTLRTHHVQDLRPGGLRLTFRGKSGHDFDVPLKDPALVRLINRCKRIPGRPLFQYIDEQGRRNRISASQVNEYLHALMGDQFTAKDFRTWGATLSAYRLLCRTPVPDSSAESACRKEIATVVRQVADAMGNTPAVCRAHYINPLVIRAWMNRRLPRANANRLSERSLIRLLADEAGA